MRFVDALDAVVVWTLLPACAVTSYAPLLGLPATYAPLLGVLVLSVHQLATFHRKTYWQLVPSLAGWLLVSASCSRVAMTLSLVGIVLRYLYPMPRLAAPSGKWHVGILEYEANRDGDYAAANDAPKVLGRLLYPTAPHSETSPYMSMNDRHGLTRTFMQVASPPALRPYLPSWILNHWAALRIDAKLGAPVGLADEKKREEWPVVVFSHGLTGSREVSTSLGLDLASAGAIVLLVEHCDGSGSLARFQDGGTLPHNGAIWALGAEPATPAYKAARRVQAATRAAELRATLEFLRDVNAGRVGPVRSDEAVRVSLDGLTPSQTAAWLAPLKGALALERVIVGGHSFGGATTLTLAAQLMSGGASAGGGDGSGSKSPSRNHHGIHKKKPPSPPFPTIGAAFTLDPAVDWVPEEHWAMLGYDGAFQDAKETSASPHGAPHAAPPTTATYRPKGAPETPPLARALPMLTVLSEQWVNFGWYVKWSAYFAGAPDAARPCHALSLSRTGHQGLCDLAHTMPHWLNAAVLKTSLGVESAEMGKAVNATVLAYLRNAGALEEQGDKCVELRSVPLTQGHVGTPKEEVVVKASTASAAKRRRTSPARG